MKNRLEISNDTLLNIFIKLNYNLKEFFYKNDSNLRLICYLK